jgi:ATP-dependent helicase HrpB
MEASWMAGQRIVMLEPRRLAATAIATRIADLLGEQVGRRAGYRVRGARRCGPDTLIEVVTEALLTRMIQNDPLLERMGLVIIDEYHERSIHADLALALALEVRRARPDLALLVMSATLEVEGVSALLGGGADKPAPVLRCPGKSFAIETRYQALEQRGRWEEGFADALERLFQRTEGDILAFLPGAGEIRRVGGRLGGLLAGRAEVFALHGMMPLSEQRVIAARDGGADATASEAGTKGRRVVLSTSIAETSLTVPGVRVVADAGWARLSRFHPATGLDRLVTERVSSSAADQRRGRAGRLGPGLCVRFWPETETLLSRPDPEIFRSDLSGLVLECALWGAKGPRALRWMDTPPESAWSQAWEILRILNLVDNDGPTALGRSVAELGLQPRLGVLMARGVENHQPCIAAACAAILEDRDGSGIRPDPDFRLRLEMIREGGAGSWRGLVTAEMERILGRSGLRSAIGSGWSAEQEDRIGNLIANAFPDRIARKEPDGTYRLVTGRVARFPGAGFGALVHVASRAAARWIVAPDADAGETAGLIRLAAPVDAETVDRVLSAVAEEMREIRWEGLVPKGYLVRRGGRLVLSERPYRPTANEIAVALREHIGRLGPAILPWNERSRSLLARMRFYSGARPERGLGDLSGAGLAQRAGEWLLPYVKLTGGHLLTADKLHAALRGILGNLAGHFESEVPEHVRLPTGGKRRIDYTGEKPAVEARIQEVFGLVESPRVCGVPVVFKLLSPANRPLQITSDLAGFWGSTYTEVRKEMRGRYPKHYWPENPIDAEPIQGVRPKTS